MPETKSKKPNMNVPVIFQNMREYESSETDERFLKVKIWLMHTGRNFNNSSFSKEVVDKHVHTLANTPILTFIEENEDGEKDFSDHRMVLHKSESGDVNLRYEGQAVGVIPESHNARWEKRVTDSGDEKEYLVVDALMWDKWDDPISIMKNKGFTGQSMELSDAYSGYWDEEGVFHFESFSFFGACLLGEGVEPAMESSIAEAQFSKKDNIKNTIESKLQEFYTLFSQDAQERGDNMTVENNQEEVKTDEVVTDYEKKQVKFEDNGEEVEETPVEPSEPEVDEAVNEPEPEESVEEPETPEENDEGDEGKEDDKKPEQEDPTPQQQETDDENTGATVDSPKKLKKIEDKYSKLQESYTSLQSEYKDLQSQLEELQSYKRQREEADIQAKFEGKLSKEELVQVFETMKDDSLESIEKEIFALIGQKNFSVQKPETKSNRIELFGNKKDTGSDNPYSALEVYLDKK